MRDDRPSPSTSSFSGVPAEDGRRGRPRDASRDDAIRRAALELVAEIGYDRTTMDAVAARAGAGKATVYRRWSTKAELVADAVAREHVSIAVPDTGSLRGDLATLTDLLFCGQGFRESDKTRLIAGLVPAMVAHPELRQAFAEIATPPERAMRAIIARAVERGEIAPPRDPSLVAALLPALAVHRLIFTGAAPDAAFAGAVIVDVILPTLLSRPRPARLPRKDD